MSLSGWLRRYHWQLAEQPVATLALHQLAPQRFQAILVPTGKPAQKLELAGVPPVHRLAPRSGRCGDPKRELTRPRRVRDLRHDATYRVTINPRGGLVAAPAGANTEALLRSAGW